MRCIPHFYQPSQIKRVRIIRRADGYYCQFIVNQERIDTKKPTSHTVGLDVGISHFYTDSDGNQVDYPQYLRQSEKQLKREQRRFSKKRKGSKNRAKARNRLGRRHLKVQHQRKDWAVKRGRCVIMSADVVAYEDCRTSPNSIRAGKRQRIPRLKVSNLVKNHCLATTKPPANDEEVARATSASSVCLKDAEVLVWANGKTNVPGVGWKTSNEEVAVAVAIAGVTA